MAPFAHSTLYIAFSSFVYMHIYITDMHTKEVNKCTITSEQSIFKKQCHSHIVRIPLVSIFQGSGIVGGI